MKNQYSESMKSKLLNSKKILMNINAINLNCHYQRQTIFSKNSFNFMIDLIVFGNYDPRNARIYFISKNLKRI